MMRTWSRRSRRRTLMRNSRGRSHKVVAEMRRFPRIGYQRKRRRSQSSRMMNTRDSMAADPMPAKEPRMSSLPAGVTHRSQAREEQTAGLDTHP
jgi:hypothetical protein